MINFIETLAAVAIVCLAAAVVSYFRGRSELARRFGVCALATGALAGLLEVYVRM